MYPESVPIIINRPEFETVEIYPIHDPHYGNDCFDEHKWNELSRHILAEPNRMVCFLGDLMENIVPNSKGDIFSQMYTPREQRVLYPTNKSSVGYVTPNERYTEVIYKV